MSNFALKNMRKTFVILLSTIYLVLSMGFTKYIHQCKQLALSSISLTKIDQQNSDKPCPNCANKEKGLKFKKEGCCKFESKVVKLDTSIQKQKNSSGSVKFLGDFIPNEMLGAVFEIPSFENLTFNHFSSSKVPVRGNPLYILHCVYRI